MNIHVLYTCACIRMICVCSIYAFYGFMGFFTFQLEDQELKFYRPSADARRKNIISCALWFPPRGRWPPWWYAPYLDPHFILLHYESHLSDSVRRCFKSLARVFAQSIKLIYSLVRKRLPQSYIFTFSAKTFNKSKKSKKLKA